MCERGAADLYGKRKPRRVNERGAVLKKRIRYARSADAHFGSSRPITRDARD